MPRIPLFLMIAALGLASTHVLAAPQASAYVPPAGAVLFADSPMLNTFTVKMYGSTHAPSELVAEYTKALGAPASNVEGCTNWTASHAATAASGAPVALKICAIEEEERAELVGLPREANSLIAIISIK
jgi:hypothetical protein